MWSNDFSSYRATSAPAAEPTPSRGAHRSGRWQSARSRRLPRADRACGRPAPAVSSAHSANSGLVLRPAQIPSVAGPMSSADTSTRNPRILARTRRSLATSGSPSPDTTASKAARILRLPSKDIGHIAFSALAHSRCSWTTFNCSTCSLYDTDKLLRCLTDLIEQAQALRHLVDHVRRPRADRVGPCVSGAAAAVSSHAGSATTASGHGAKAVRLASRCFVNNVAPSCNRCTIARASERKTNRQSRPAACGKVRASTPTAPRARRLSDKRAGPGSSGKSLERRSTACMPG